MLGSGVSLRFRNKNKKRNGEKWKEKNNISEREKNEKILKERIQWKGQKNGKATETKINKKNKRKED